MESTVDANADSRYMNGHWVAVYFYHFSSYLLVNDLLLEFWYSNTPSRVWLAQTKRFYRVWLPITYYALHFLTQDNRNKNGNALTKSASHSFSFGFKLGFHGFKLKFHWNKVTCGVRTGAINSLSRLVGVKSHNWHGLTKHSASDFVFRSVRDISLVWPNQTCLQLI